MTFNKLNYVKSWKGKKKYLILATQATFPPTYLYAYFGKICNAIYWKKNKQKNTLDGNGKMRIKSL